MGPETHASYSGSTGEDDICQRKELMIGTFPEERRTKRESTDAKRALDLCFVHRLAKLENEKGSRE